MRLYVLIPLFLSINLLIAQKTPGYMGKRFVAGYGLYLSPGIIGSDGNTAFNNLHEGYIEYAAKKKFIVGFSGRFYKAIYGNTRGINLDDLNRRYNIDMRGPRNPEGTYQISAMNFMLYGKFYKRNYLAPWGKYFLIGISIQRYTATYNPSEMKISYSYSSFSGPSYNYVFNNFGPVEQDFTRADLTIGFGRNRMIGDRITIDYGYNLNVLATVLTVFDVPGDNLSEDNSDPTMEEYIGTTSASRIRGVNRFNIFLKIGILIF